MLTHGPVKVERWKPEQTHASAYLRANGIIFHGNCLTSIGGLACDPYIRMDASASDDEVGTALLRVLAEARLTPIPTDHKAEQQKILRTAGVRSWSKLSEGVCCSITQKPTDISLLPTRREGRAFIHMVERTVWIAEEYSPDQVGRALREGFQRCT